MKRRLLWTFWCALFFCAAVEADAQQTVVMDPGDTLTVFVPEIPPVPPETTFVPSPPVTDTLYECPPGWTQTFDGEAWTCEPLVEAPTEPPIPVVSMDVFLEGDTLVTVWTPAPNDRATGYEINAGNNATGKPYLPRDTIPVGAPFIHRRPGVDPGKNWTCVSSVNLIEPASPRCDNAVYTPPEPVTLYTLHLSTTRDGPRPVADGDEIDADSLFTHLQRTDGSWFGMADVAAPGVDSIWFSIDGVRNRERFYPYHAGAGDVLIWYEGQHVITWEVFGDEPGSGSVGFTAVVQVGSLDSKIEACFVEMRSGQRGIYYSPAADACVNLVDMVDRDEVNRIHADYWHARGTLVNDDPFPGTTGDLNVDGVGLKLLVDGVDTPFEVDSITVVDGIEMWWIKADTTEGAS